MECIELWGGVECSHVRVGNQYSDQLSRSGHDRRLEEDLERFAALGIKSLRFPVLWERCQPNLTGPIDWDFADRGLNKLRKLGIEPIVGFVHHGSGPRHTSLVSADFATGVAAFAYEVAKRYPWVKRYTPVNEPLTTARFSGLYGFWYPHGRSDVLFVRALLNQIEAVRLSMKAIRGINPEAELVQTEDLGKAQCTPELAYQARFENNRRWLTFDLLCGKVKLGHALWRYLRKHGAGEAELLQFVENPCPPQVLGINYYITSERFLDKRYGRYPHRFRGSNGKHVYADVETVRVQEAEPYGPAYLLKEASKRYKLPIAITEAHLGCTREEQMRWLNYMWQQAEKAKEAGADVKAVTAWSLLGSFDWNSLLTKNAGHYECGVFDARAATPHPTGLTALLHDLAIKGSSGHPVLAAPGWWQSDNRHRFGPEAKPLYLPPPGPPLLITGATGTLGRAFARICQERGLAYILTTRKELDLASSTSVQAAIQHYRPWAIVNAAGYVKVDEAESDPRACLAANTKGVENLAKACAEAQIKLLTFSSDLVFDGGQDEPYTESSLPNPLNVYGQSKALAEEWALSILPNALVIRTSAFFSPWDKYNFVYAVLEHLQSGRVFCAAEDQIITATYVPDLVHASLNLLIDNATGIWHLSSPGAISWAYLAREVALAAEQDANLIEGFKGMAPWQIATRPGNTALSSERGDFMRPFNDVLHDTVHQLKHLLEQNKNEAQSINKAVLMLK